jgi:hypothetical protein
VFSYYTASHNQLNKIERQSGNNTSIRQKSRLGGTLFISFIIVAMLSMLGYLSILGIEPTLQLNSGPKLRAGKEYQQTVSDMLKQDIRNRTKYSLNTKKIEKKMYMIFPELKSVRISAELLGHRPIVGIESYNVMAIFVQGDNQKYLLSDHGKIMLSSDDSNFNYSNLPVINNSTTFQSYPGMQFFKPSEAKDIADLIYQLKKDKAKYSIKLNNQPHEIELHEKGRGYYVRFLLDDNSILNQYGAMRAVQNKQIVANEYLDVRLADKVFYK